jgi:hypothetical protein
MLYRARVLLLLAHSLGGNLKSQQNKNRGSGQRSRKQDLKEAALQVTFCGYGPLVDLPLNFLKVAVMGSIEWQQVLWDITCGCLRSFFSSPVSGVIRTYSKIYPEFPRSLCSTTSSWHRKIPLGDQFVLSHSQVAHYSIYFVSDHILRRSSRIILQLLSICCKSTSCK